MDVEQIKGSIELNLMMGLKFVLFLQEDKYQDLLMEIESLILLENVHFLFILAYYWI